MFHVFILRRLHSATIFERKGESQFPNAQPGIAITCLTYLSFDIFGTGNSNDYKSYHRKPFP